MDLQTSLLNRKVKFTYKPGYGQPQQPGLIGNIAVVYMKGEHPYCSIVRKDGIFHASISLHDIQEVENNTHSIE